MKKFSTTTTKMVSLAIIIILLLIGNVMIKSKLEDREFTYNQAVSDIEKSAGGNLESKGPLIVIPYKEKIIENSYEKTITKHEILYPSVLKYDADINTEKRTLGIYSAPVYSGDINIHSEFDFDSKSLNKRKYEFEEAFIFFEISDKNLQNKPEFKINGKLHPVKLFSFGNYEGLSCKIKIENGKYLFDTKLKIHGASSFSVFVSANDTSLSIKSNWPSPGFTKYDFLPTERNLNKNGFEAKWSIPFANAEANHEIGVYFIDPVNVYKKLDRAVTYGFLFIIVPFIVLLLFEFLAKVQLHPLQYLLSGAASVLFFLLLMAFSEHISFLKSYIIAAFAAGLSVSLYISSISQKKKFGLSMSIVFSALYIYLYFSLKSEDYALLIGSIFAFAIVTILMFFTRNGILFHRDKGNIREIDTSKNSNC